MSESEARLHGIARQILKGLDEEKTDALVDYLAEVTAETLKRAAPPVAENVLRELGHTEEVAGLLQLLAAKSGDSREGVLRKALNLYGIALDVLERGDRLAILNPEDEIVQEITGFRATVGDPQPIG